MVYGLWSNKLLMKIYKLNKKVLSITNNPSPFLNGLTSNTLDKSKNAFLDVHGKIIATFDQIKINEDQFFILIEQPFVEMVLKHLDRFARLSQVGIQQEDYRVYFDLEGAYKVETNEFVIPQKLGQLVITQKDLENKVSEEEFIIFRLRNHIPVHGIDYQNEMLLNVDETEYVSFTKGCFLGQEPVSKVHNRSKPTWKLVVKYADDPSLEQKQSMTSSMVDPSTRRIFGFAFVKNE